MRVMSGAWVSRARLQAAEGAPMPTKQTSEEVSARAAVTLVKQLQGGAWTAVGTPLSDSSSGFLGGGDVTIAGVGGEPFAARGILGEEFAQRGLVGVVGRLVRCAGVRPLGRGQGAPIEDDLQVYPVRVEGDDVLVQLPPD